MDVYDNWLTVTKAGLQPAQQMQSGILVRKNLTRPNSEALQYLGPVYPRRTGVLETTRYHCQAAGVEGLLVLHARARLGRPLAPFTVPTVEQRKKSDVFLANKKRHPSLVPQSKRRPLLLEM